MIYYKAQHRDYDTNYYLICSSYEIAEKAICKLFYNEYLHNIWLEDISLLKEFEKINNFIIAKDFSNACKIIFEFDKSRGIGNFSIVKEEVLTNIETKSIDPDVFQTLYKELIFK